MLAHIPLFPLLFVRRMLPLAALAVIVLWGVESAAQAAASRQPVAEQHPVSDAEPSLFEFTVGVQGTVGFGAACQRREIDRLRCTQGPLAVGLELSPRLRLTRKFALGLLAEVSVVSQPFDNSVFLMRTSVLGRWYPKPGSDASPWLDLDLGLATVLERVPADPVGPSETFVTLAPTAGLGAGFYVKRTANFGLGLQVRAMFLGFSGSTPTAPRGVTYDPQGALSFAVVGSFM